MALSGGRTSGFDYIRICLAFSIILWHGIIVSYGSEVEARYWQSPIGVGYRFVLPMFFALSGFLVAGSLDRCRTLVSFFGLRILRIVPALAVEVTLSALIFGPLLTTRKLEEYFSSWQLFRYFLNIIGDIHYVLPGLFESNPHPDIVNNQLWTIPYELQCYLIIGGLAATAILRNRWLLLGIACLAQALWVWHELNLGSGGAPRAPIASGQVLIIAFLCGVIIHIFRNQIYLNHAIFLGCVVVGVLLAYLPNGGIYLPFPASYITIYIGLLNPRTNRFLKSGDYSYGLYLYGYPIQQAVASYGVETHKWWINIGVSLPIALTVAFFSWHVVEKRALAARRRIPAIEDGLLAVVLGAGARADGAWRRFALRLGSPLRFGMQVCVLGGVALLIDGQEYQGATAIFVTLVGCIWLSSLGRNAVEIPISG